MSTRHWSSVQCAFPHLLHVLLISPVDQPVGTGFSYGSSTDYVHDLDQVATQVVEFMRNFYTVFPEFQNMEVSNARS